MFRNEHGGILSKVFIIPAGVVVIIGVFLAGYFMGKREGAGSIAADRPPALPEVVSQYLPNKEDITFYKTLTDRGEKTVSVDLKPRPKTDDPGQARKEGEAGQDPASAGKQTAERPATARAEPQTKAQHPNTAPKKEPAAPAPKGRFTVQIGAYPDKAMAEEEVRNMKRRGYAAFLVATKIPEKGTWYRVRIGSFTNKQAAEKLAAELTAKEGTSSFVTAE